MRNPEQARRRTLHTLSISAAARLQAGSLLLRLLGQALGPPRLVLHDAHAPLVVQLQLVHNALHPLSLRATLHTFGTPCTVSG